MAKVHDIIEGLFDDVTKQLEAMTPDGKPAKGFRRQDAQSRMERDIRDVQMPPRLFEFGRNEMKQTTIAIGSGKVRYDLWVPIDVVYPVGEGWHAAIFDDWSKVFSTLLDNPSNVSGVQLRTLDMSRSPELEQMENGAALHARFTLFAHIEADR